MAPFSHLRYIYIVNILAIETSCDETSIAIVKDGSRVLGEATASTCAAFRQSGGVIPEQAARKQIEFLLPVLHQALRESGCPLEEIDAIAVTKGPGLLTSLLVGTTAARVLASVWSKPLIGVHHTMGHLSSLWLLPDGADPPHFPAVSLSASGGHTDIWYRASHTRGRLLGRTRDDAAGEAFDKGANLLSLPYPGGPEIAAAAEGGDPRAYDFPLPLRDAPGLDFSFSGLKTSLKYLLRDMAEGQRKKAAPHLAASYQEAICVHLADRATKAIERHSGIREVHLTGGVSANIRLREMLRGAIAPLPLRHPAHIRHCTDNAAMVGAAAFFLWKEKGDAAFAPFETVASLQLEMAISPEH